MFVCVGGFLYKLCGTVIAFGSRGNSFKYIREKKNREGRVVVGGGFGIRERRVGSRGTP